MAEIKYTPLDKTILAALVGKERYDAHQEAVEVARKSGEDLLTIIKKNPLFAHYLASIGGDSHITVEAGNDGEISLIWDGSKRPKNKKANPPPLPGGRLADNKGPNMKALRARAEALGVDISDLGRKRTAISERLAEHEGWNRAGEEAVVTVASLPVVTAPVTPPAPQPSPPPVAPRTTPAPSLADAMGDIFEDASETLTVSSKVDPFKGDSDEVVVDTYVPIKRTPRIRTGAPVPVTVVDLAAKVREAAEMDLARALSEEVDDSLILKE